MKQSLVRVAAFRRDHPRGWTFACTVLLAGLSLLIGLGVTVYDGVMNPLPRPRAFFILVGLFAFYAPGLLMAAAAVGLRRGWTRLVWLGALAALAQGAMAAVATFGQFAFTPFMMRPMVEFLLWSAADFYVAWRLWQSIPWVAADAVARVGFEVDMAEAEVA